MVSIILLWGLRPDPGQAAEVRYELGLLSHYSWRGITLTDDPVFQPGLEISHENGISLEVWGNADLGDDNDTRWEVNELRVAGEYGWRTDPFRFRVGLIEYLFPNAPFPGTREVFARLEYPRFVAPRLTVYYDFDEIEGVYADLAIEYDHRLGQLWNLEAVLGAGFADSAFAIGPDSGFHDGRMELGLEMVVHGYSLELQAAYTDSLDRRVLPDQPVGLWGGFVVSKSF